MNSSLLLLLLLPLVAAYPVRDINLAEYRTMTSAMYHSFRVRGNIKFWMQCLKNYLEEANENLRIAISCIQDIRPTKIFTLCRGLQHYKNYVANTIYDCRPCADFNKDPELKRLWNLIDTINWQNMIKNLSRRFNLIMDNFKSTREYWNKGDMANYGKSIAALILSCLDKN
eukprot:TRINITY_DN4074_c0_g3_i13.p1 TRINITY_DN4074_c0_g3~~TRINITY_DN4074_c0_g3_i13.p1  ORF type:complete len:171 (-),score=35.27 TRINITY_DN4074_c0_g3_i13:150-662(-)